MGKRGDFFKGSDKAEYGEFGSLVERLNDLAPFDNYMGPRGTNI